MAKLTKAQARTLIRQFIDDEAATLWSNANLDILTTGVLDELWTDLLEHSPFLLSMEEAPTVTSPGYVDLDTELTRWFRIQQVVRENFVYTPADQKDAVVNDSEVVSADGRTYTLLGSELHLFPYDTTANVRIKYNYLPPSYGGLGDSDEVEWPDGHHLAYVYAVASRAMEKGDREDSARFERRAENALLKLKAVLRKRHTGPTMPWFDHDALEAGGV